MVYNTRTRNSLIFNEFDHRNLRENDIQVASMVPSAAAIVVREVSQMERGDWRWMEVGEVKVVCTPTNGDNNEQTGHTTRDNFV